MIFVAHDLSVVEHISDRIAVMYVGKIVEMTETTELLQRPLHPYTEAYSRPFHRPIQLRGEVPNPANPPSGCVFHTRCAYAQPVCAQQEPALEEITPGYFASCHFSRELHLKGIGEQTFTRKPSIP